MPLTDSMAPNAKPAVFQVVALSYKLTLASSDLNRIVAFIVPWKCRGATIVMIAI